MCEIDIVWTRWTATPIVSKLLHITADETSLKIKAVDEFVILSAY